MIEIALVASGSALRAGLHVLLAAEADFHLGVESGFLTELDALPEDTTVLVLAGEANLSLSPQEYKRFSNQGILFLVDPVRPLPPILMENELTLWGLLPHDCTPAELSTAVRGLSEGLVIADGLLLRSLNHQRRNRADLETRPLDQAESNLTRRELEVLQLLAQGLTNKQIALSLGISEHTVKFHISSIYTKMDVMNRADVVRAGISRGWISI